VPSSAARCQPAMYKGADQEGGVGQSYPGQCTRPERVTTLAIDGEAGGGASRRAHGTRAGGNPGHRRGSGRWRPTVLSRPAHRTRAGEGPGCRRGSRAAQRSVWLGPWFKISRKFLEISFVSWVHEIFAFCSKNSLYLNFLTKKHAEIRFLQQILSFLAVVLSVYYPLVMSSNPRSLKFLFIFNFWLK
jgi:hypothetical protein